jgi:hypothetical protein
MAMTNPEDEIDAIEALLPWYAAGTLSAQDAQRVEDALARRPELQASLRLAQQDREETIALNEQLGTPGAAPWEKVLASANAAPRSPGLGSRLSAWLGLGADRGSARWAWGGAAAAVVIAAQGAAIFALLPRSNGPNYQTASENTAVAEGAEVLVAFAPEARVDQIGAWLDAHHASIVEGPRGGMYLVRVGNRRLSKEEMAALVADLSQAPFVRTVLPEAGK